MNMIFIFRFLQVTDSDPLPHVICEKCAEQLDALYGFKETARKTEDLLHQFLAYTKQLLGSSQVSPHNQASFNKRTNTFRPI